MRWQLTKWKESVKSPTLTWSSEKSSEHSIQSDSEESIKSYEAKTDADLAEAIDPRGNWASWNQEKKSFGRRPN